MDSLDFFFFVSSKVVVSEINMTPLRVKTLLFPRGEVLGIFKTCHETY